MVFQCLFIKEQFPNEQKYLKLYKNAILLDLIEFFFEIIT